MSDRVAHTVCIAQVYIHEGIATEGDVKIKYLNISQIQKGVRGCARKFPLPPTTRGARNRVGIGLSYRPARLRRLAKLIPWNTLAVLLKSSNSRSDSFSNV
jgi:hypothetical protein